MPAAQPQTKAHEAFLALVAMAENGTRPSDLDLRRVERVARDSIGVDAVNAYQALGVVGMLRWSIEMVRENFRHAMRLSSSADILANFARALADINQPSEAAEQMESAALREPENLEFLRGAIAYRFCAGEWSRADELLKTLALRILDSDDEMQSFKNAIDLSKAIGVREETVRKTIDCALRFLSERKICAKHFSHGSDRMPGEECIYINLHIDPSDGNARALDEELTPLLFDEIDDLQLGSFVLYIEPTDSTHVPIRLH